jgi:predicted hydrocarbon binding protein
MGFINESLNINDLDFKFDVMKEKLQKNISLKIQERLSEERSENFLINLVFQHLTPQELLKYSLTSKRWYYEIGKTFGDRFAIKCSTENLDILEKSERYYRKIEIIIGNTWWEIEDAEKIILKYSPHLSSIKLVKFGG